MGWPRRITALGGGRGEGEGETPESACLCLTTSGGAAAVDNPTGGSRCFCTTVSGGAASVQVGSACRTVSGGAANAQVLCRSATVSGGTATMNNAPAAFANGYAARRRIVLEAMPDLPAVTLADFPQPIPGALLAGLLKDAAHAGRVQSAAGWDIRVEIGGDNPTGTPGPGWAKLDHHLAAYDPAAGTPFLFARHQRQSAIREVLFVYYGKAGLSASETNPAGAWVAAAAARFWPSGADVTGHGLSFATLSGITTAGVTIAGLPGARMVAASFARVALPAGGILDGLGAVTNHYLANWTAPFPTSGNGERVGGTAVGTADFSQFAASGVLNSGWIPEDAAHSRAGQNNSVALSTSADVDAGNAHSWHFTNQSGQNCGIWRDGVRLATVFSGGGNDHTAGTIGIDGSENDSFGAGTGTQTTAIPGDYGPSIIYSTAPSATWIAAFDRCLLDPLAWMGVGAEELPGDAAGSPVAMPAPATVTAGVQSDIDVAAPAFVPTGATAPVLSTVGTAADGGGPAHGSVAAASGKARLTESAAYKGADRFGFTLSSSGRLLVPARSIVTVLPGVIVSADGLAPAFPDAGATAVVGPVPIASLQATYNALTPAQIAGGVTILVTPGGTLSGNLALGKSGIKGTGKDDYNPQFPICVRVGTLSGGHIVDSNSFPAGTITGQVTFSGDYNWLRGFTSGGLHFSTRTGNRFNRCKFTTFSKDQGVSNTLDWCEWSNQPGVFHQCQPTQGCRTPFIYRCYMHTDVGTIPGNRVFLQIGFNDTSTAIPTFAYVRDCLFADPFDDPNNRVEQAVEIKAADCVVERCAALSRLSPTVRPLRFNIRHGQRNTFKALWCDKGQIEARGPGHLMADCIITGTDYVGPSSGNCSYAQWLVFVSNNQQSGKYPSADNCRVVRCDNVGVGDSASGTGTPPVGTQLWNIGGFATLLNGATVAAPDIHAGDPTDVPPRGDSGAIKWSTSQVGPNGAWNPADGGT